jgi:thioredoxin reductase (NADPH)
METSMAGVFAVGDARHGSVKRVASAVGAGSIAVQSVHEYINLMQRERSQPAAEQPITVTKEADDGPELTRMTI